MKIRSLMRILPLATGLCLVLSGTAQAQRADVEPVPVCIYGSQSFSEGAQVCAQRNAMLTCTASGDKVVWKAETDRQLNARCVTTFQAERAAIPAPAPRVMAWRARTRPLTTAAPLAPSSGTNCFTFNNRRFCE